MYRLSQNRILFGICSGLSDFLKVDLFLIRLIFLVLFFVFGLSFFVYFALALSFPKKTQEGIDQTPFILGICSKISKRQGLDLGLLRLITLSGFIITFGTALLIYIILYFIIPSEE